MMRTECKSSNMVIGMNQNHLGNELFLLLWVFIVLCRMAPCMHEGTHTHTKKHTHTN